MRKGFISTTTPERRTTTDAVWLALDQAAAVEITSEDPAHPIEAALRAEEGHGWHAQEPGAQTIRLHFDSPQRIRRIRLVFDEPEATRTQEFTLRWSSDGGQSYQELFRQQFNFSPPGTTREVEDYWVEVEDVDALELRIVPDIRGGEHRASLSEWRVA